MYKNLECKNEREEDTMKEKEQDHFTGKMLGRLLVPSMVAAIGLAAGDMADAVVIGQRMGATGLAAVSLALPVFMVVNVLVHGLGIGGSVKYSKYMGEGKEEAAVDNFNQILLAGVAVSVLLAVLGNLFLVQVMQGCSMRSARSMSAPFLPVCRFCLCRIS